jgi:hypothetical protein
MKTTLKVALVAFGGSAVGALIGLLLIFAALPRDMSWDGPESDSGSPATAIAGVAFALLAISGSVWLAARIAGRRPDRQ